MVPTYLEQWPHLNELVQYYKADWVKAENNYGHYESIPSISFQSELFEGPDIDIEIGKSAKIYHYFTRRNSFILSFCSLKFYLKCVTSLPRFEVLFSLCS